MDIGEFFLGLFAALRTIGVKTIIYDDQLITESIEEVLSKALEKGLDLDFPISAINVITNEGLESIARYGLIAHPNPTYKRISLELIKTPKGGEQYLTHFFEQKEIFIFKNLAETFISSILKNKASVC